MSHTRIDFVADSFMVRFYLARLYRHNGTIPLVRKGEEYLSNLSDQPFLNGSTLMELRLFERSFLSGLRSVPDGLGIMSGSSKTADIRNHNSQPEDRQQSAGYQVPHPILLIGTIAEESVPQINAESAGDCH
jgi:hypothetical protein